MRDETRQEVLFLLAQMKEAAAYPEVVARLTEEISCLVQEPAIPHHAFERPRVVFHNGQMIVT